jgi:putative mycofactocin binding protein MftB
VGCTEPPIDERRPAERGGPAAAGRPQHFESGVYYILPPWVRVRREDFGLLFYDARSTKLTYVRSGDSLLAPPFTGTRRVLGFARPDEARRPAVARLLQDLLAKGLIVAVAPD